MVVYNLLLTHVSIRKVLLISQVTLILSATGHVIFLNKVTLGLNPFVYVIILQLVSDTFQLAFMAMPLMATVAKLIPHSVEATVFAFFTGISILN